MDVDDLEQHMRDIHSEEGTDAPDDADEGEGSVM